MKVALITLTGYFNYGNRLQNYASQEVLKMLGYEVETIPIEFKSIKRKIKNIIGFLNSKTSIINHPRLNEFTKEYKFYKFTSQNIKYSKYYLPHTKDKEMLKLLDKEYNYFLTGSDQVFNPYYGDVEIFYLSFIQKYKRLSYAASFGIDSIAEEYKEQISMLLAEFKALSVREEKGREIIKELCDRESTVLIDPTMMLSKEEWLKVSSKPKGYSHKKYILTYVLGNETEEFKEFVYNIANNKKLEIVNILNHNNKDMYCCDPSEFVYLINNASLVVTDSFHGAVFSIIMKTPFVIFERQDEHHSMNSRIETLTTTFNMRHRLISEIDCMEDVFNVNFESIDMILKREKEKAFNFLKSNISTTS